MDRDSKSGASPVGVWGALIVVYLVWSSTYLAIRFAVENIPPFYMAAARFLIAGSLLFAWRMIRRDDLPGKPEWRSAAIIGLFLLVGGNGGVVWAEQRIPSGIAALIVGSAPLFMVVLEAVISREKRPRFLELVGVLIGFVGITVLVNPFSSTGEGRHDLAATLVILMSAFFWAVGSVYSRRARLPGSPLLGTSMEMLAGGLGLFILGTLFGEYRGLHLSAFPARSLWSLLYLIIFGSLVGFATYTWLLRVAPISLVSTYAYVNPILAIVLGNILAREPINGRVFSSALIILGSVALITTRKKTKNSPRRTHH